ncbi:cobalt transporter [Treponema sp. OMZ 840]|uniref:nickel/cobalt transporter n=1 Tax=Treponema sp. OMZ 840 TaxID=244313 RepID=UPI003D9192D0
MRNTKRTIFICALCALFFTIAAPALKANPLYTPGAAGAAQEQKKTNSGNGQAEQNEAAQTKEHTPDAQGADIKQLRPVRISGASSELIGMQRSVRERVGDLLYAFKEGKAEGSLSSGKNTGILRLLFILSFLYGILHAAGPGHRKTLVFSLYLTRCAPVWEPFAASCVLTFLHGGTAVALILILKGVESSLGASADRIGIYLEGFSYLLIILTAAVLLVKESVEFFMHGRCSCGGRHRLQNTKLPAKQSAPNASFEKTGPVQNISLISLFVSGLYPCPGAVLVLILSYTLDVTGLGIICVFIMSAGMALPVGASAYLAWAGRSGLFQILKKNRKSAAALSFAVEAFGYVLLIVFSLYIALPFFKNFI